MIFQERFTLNAQKEIKHLDLEISKKILDFILSLKKNPFPIGAIRNNDEDFQNVLKIKFENYIIIYEILFQESIFIIHLIYLDN